MNLEDFEFVSGKKIIYEIYGENILINGNEVIIRYSNRCPHPKKFKLKFLGSIPSNKLESILENSRKWFYNLDDEYYFEESVDFGNLSKEINIGDRIIGEPSEQSEDVGFRFWISGEVEKLY